MPEIRVAKLDELEPGRLRQVTVAGVEVLVARVGDAVWATSAHCSHYGAPLAEGVLHGRRVICPWHHAVFDLATGKQLEPPGCGDLQRFPARVENGNVWVTVTAPVAEQAPSKASSTSDHRLMAIVGAGAAGTSAAITLRREGYAGRIVLLSRERRLPYDRTLLSKEVLQGIEPPCPVALHPEAFYRDLDIELRLDCEVRRLDTDARTISLKNGDLLVYDACLVATGGNPKLLHVPGERLPEVCTLRSWDDSDRLLAALASTHHAVIVGSSFIGLECAASLRARNIAVTVVTPEKHPFARLFGDRISAALVATHEAQGTKFLLGDEIAGFEGQEHLKAVVTKQDMRIAADLAIVGIGIAPATESITGIELAGDGGIVVDEFLQAAEGLFAAGDIAAFKLPLTGERTRIEHWRLACEQGSLAACNMLGQRKAYVGAPFFWSAQKLALYYVGHADATANIVIDGEPGRGAFIAYYSQGGRIVAALGVERNAEMAALQELARLDLLPGADELGQNFDAVARLRQVMPD